MMEGLTQEHLTVVSQYSIHPSPINSYVAFCVIVINCGLGGGGLVRDNIAPQQTPGSGPTAQLSVAYIVHNTLHCFIAGGVRSIVCRFYSFWLGAAIDPSPPNSLPDSLVPFDTPPPIICLRPVVLGWPSAFAGRAGHRTNFSAHAEEDYTPIAAPSQRLKPYKIRYDSQDKLAITLTQAVRRLAWVR